MPNRITRHSASAALTLLPDGVLIVRLCGPLTGDALMHFKAEIVARHGPEIRAFVADYTTAIIALTGPDLDQVLEGEADSAPGLPAAIICRPEQNGLFRGHALRVAGSHGIIRRVFNEQGPAVEWVQRLVNRRAA